MKKYLTLFAFTLFLGVLFPVQAQAEYKPEKIFSLSDGTTLKGVLIGIRQNDNAYLIETETMGTVAIHPKDVLNMANAALPASQHAIAQPSAQSLQNTLPSETIEKAQEVLLSDPAISHSIQELISDPEIVKLLQDPQVMQAIMSMDPETIQSNPKIQKLLQNPAMQKLIQQSGQKLIQNDSP